MQTAQARRRHIVVGGVLICHDWRRRHQQSVGRAQIYTTLKNLRDGVTSLAINDVGENGVHVTL
jgi:hypothetical protein